MTHQELATHVWYQSDKEFPIETIREIIRHVARILDDGRAAEVIYCLIDYGIDERIMPRSTGHIRIKDKRVNKTKPSLYTKGNNR